MIYKTSPRIFTPAALMVLIVCSFPAHAFDTTDTQEWRIQSGNFNANLKAGIEKEGKDNVVSNFKFKSGNHRVVFKSKFNQDPFYFNPKNHGDFFDGLEKNGDFFDDLGEGLPDARSTSLKYTYRHKLNNKLKFYSTWDLENIGRDVVNRLNYRPTSKLKFDAELHSSGELLGKFNYKHGKYWRFASKWNQEPGPTWRNERISGSVKYKGFGKFLVPTVGVTLQQKDYDDSGRDFTRQSVWLEARSQLSSTWSLHSKASFYNKDYVTSDQNAAYFGRDDQYADLGVWLLNQKDDWGIWYNVSNHTSTLESKAGGTTNNIWLLYWRDF